jgi:hypothetical protein
MLKFYVRSFLRNRIPTIFCQDLVKFRTFHCLMIGYYVTKVNNNLPRCKFYFKFVMALAITFGGMCSCRSFGVACVFAGWLGELSLSLNYLWSLWAKTMTPRGSPRREPGRAVAPATKPPL